MTAMNHHRTQYHSPFTEVPLHGIEAHDLMKLPTPTGQAGRGRGGKLELKTVGSEGTYPIPIPSMYDIFTYMWLFF